MSDLAKAAGLTRPTLYQSFPDKESVFGAVIEAMASEMFARIREGVEERSDLHTKLLFACETWGAGGFEMVQQNPDAKDMFDLCFDPVQKTYAEFEGILTDILRESISRAGLNIRARDLAHIIVFSIRGFKDAAHDGKEMRRLIGQYVTVLVTAFTTPKHG